MGAASGSQLVLASSAAAAAGVGRGRDHGVRAWCRCSPAGVARPITSRRAAAQREASRPRPSPTSRSMHTAVRRAVSSACTNECLPLCRACTPSGRPARRCASPGSASSARPPRAGSTTGVAQQPAGAQVVRAHRVVRDVARRVLDQVHRPAVRRDRVEAEVAPQRDVAPHRERCACPPPRRSCACAGSACRGLIRTSLRPSADEAARRPVVRHRRNRERSPAAAARAPARRSERARSAGCRARRPASMYATLARRAAPAGGVDAHRGEPVGARRGRHERRAGQHGTRATRSMSLVRRTAPAGSLDRRIASAMSDAPDTVVVGGGQAGLSVSHELTAAGVPHVVLERGPGRPDLARALGQLLPRHPELERPAPGPSLRRGRSARLHAPRRDRRLPGALRARASTRRCARASRSPRSAADATAASCSTPRTARSRRGTWSSAPARTSGRTARRARRRSRPTSSRSTSRHTATRTSCPPGAVLVVGSGQSGCQIAEELHVAGRDVFLACGRAGWAPRRISGHDTRLVAGRGRQLRRPRRGPA